MRQGVEVGLLVARGGRRYSCSETETGCLGSQSVDGVFDNCRVHLTVMVTSICDDIVELA